MKRPNRENEILLQNIAKLNLDETENRDANNEEIKVTFKTMLSPDFRSKNVRVFITMGQPVSDFKSPVVAMKMDRKVFDDFHIYKGHFFLPKDFQGQNIAYKYVIHTDDGKIEWEALPNRRWNPKGIVNRCLNVPTKIQDIYEKIDEGNNDV